MGDITFLRGQHDPSPSQHILKIESTYARSPVVLAHPDNHWIMKKEGNHQMVSLEFGGLIDIGNVFLFLAETREWDCLYVVFTFWCL